MPGLGTGPRPGGWETLIYGKAVWPAPLPHDSRSLKPRTAELCCSLDRNGQKSVFFNQTSKAPSVMLIFWCREYVRLNVMCWIRFKIRQVWQADNTVPWYTGHCSTDYRQQSRAMPANERCTTTRHWQRASPHLYSALSPSSLYLTLPLRNSFHLLMCCLQRKKRQNCQWRRVKGRKCSPISL